MVQIKRLPDGPQPEMVTARPKYSSDFNDPFSMGSDIEGNSFDAMTDAYLNKHLRMLEYGRNYRALNPGQIKIWRIENKSLIKKYKIQYRIDNRDSINSYHRSYRKTGKILAWERANRDRINTRRRERRMETKETPKQRSERCRKAANKRWNNGYVMS